MVDYVLPHSIPQEDERLTLMSRMLDPQMFFRLEQLGVRRAGAASRSAPATAASRTGWRRRSGPPATSSPATSTPASSTGSRCRTSRSAGSTSPATRSATATTWSAAGPSCTTSRNGSTCSDGSSEAVRPGGFILLEEPDFHPVLATDSPVMRGFWQGFLAWAANQGIDYFVGRRIAPLLAGLGVATRSPSTARPSCSTAARCRRATSTLTMRELEKPLLASGLVGRDRLDRGDRPLRQPAVLDLAEQLRHDDRPQASGLGTLHRHFRKEGAGRAVPPGPRARAAADRPRAAASRPPAVAPLPSSRADAGFGTATAKVGAQRRSRRRAPPPARRR